MQQAFAAQIVTGVGFIGAGVILHEKGEVQGSQLPPAFRRRPRWASASAPVTCYLRGARTAIMLFVAAVLPWFERRIVRTVSRAYTITTHIDPDRRPHLQATFLRCGLQAHCDSQSKRGELMQTVWHVTGSAQ